MHYQDGTAAQVGDIVKGTAYNTKNPDGSKRTIVALMLQITPGESCNCVVGLLEVVDCKPEESDFIRNNYLGTAFPVVYLNEGIKRLVAKTDYSECRAFELLYRPG